MASHEKRGNSYRITASCGIDVNGKQIRHYMTWKPDSGMTAKQIEKELERQKVLFQEQCDKGLVTDGKMKFRDFAADWCKYKKRELRPTTYARYESMLPRINAALGHMRLEKIQPIHLNKFYENLLEGGIRLDTKYKSNIDLNDYLKKNKLSKAELARRSDLPASSVATVCKKGKCTRSTAEKLSKGMAMPLSKAFAPIDTDKPLSTKTVQHHHRLLSSMFSTAVEWGMLLYNPCDRVRPPRVEKKDPRYLDEVQAATLFDLLENERADYRTMIRVFVFTGLRRGELLGLKWSDINFDSGVMQICRTTQYLPDRGVYEDETKNDSSNRVMKLPQTAIADLKQHKVYQLERRLKAGDRWQDTGYVFTTDEGKPVHPDTITGWFSKFVKAHSEELPYISVHSLRHTNATLQIAGGVPLPTIAKRLGHADTVTTSRIYAHAIKSADEAAAETLENILTPTQNRTA